MKNNILTRLLIATALLIFAIPVVASGQYYPDRFDRRDVHDAIVRLDNSTWRLENDLSNARSRRVLGFLWVTQTDNTAIAEVRDFRRAVRQLRNASADGRDLRG